VTDPSTELALSPAPFAWLLIFQYRGPVLGHGFVAVVEFQGPVLGRPTESNGSIWIDGVNPGGFAFGAANPQSVRAELQSALSRILIDIAEDAPSFDAFKADVKQFFRDTDAETEGQWEACVRKVRGGRRAAARCRSKWCVASSPQASSQAHAKAWMAGVRP
jgi:hypothetical protein